MKKIYVLTFVFIGVGLILLGVYFMVQRNVDRRVRQAEIHDRGSLVMPFDLNKTTHYFQQTDTGGVMQIKTINPDNQEQILLIRQHLQKEADLFADADFSDPESLHGADMPGLPTLSSAFGKFSVQYAELADGAQLTYQTDDPEVITAFHQWFMAQLMDHGSDAIQN